MIHVTRVEEVGFCSFVFDNTGDLLAVKDPHTLRTLLTIHNEKDVVYLTPNPMNKGMLGKFTHSDVGALSSMVHVEIVDGRKISLTMLNAIITEFLRYRVAGISLANDKIDSDIDITDSVLFDIGSTLFGPHTFKGVCYVHPAEMVKIPGYETLRTISDKDHIYQSVCIDNKVFYRVIEKKDYVEDPIKTLLTPYTCLVKGTEVIINYDKDAKYGIPSQVEFVKVIVDDDFLITVTDLSKTKTYQPYVLGEGVKFSNPSDVKDLRGYIKNLYRR